MRSPTDPFSIPISNQLHLENRIFPVSALHENSSFISRNISQKNSDEKYSDYELCVTQASQQHLMQICITWSGFKAMMRLSSGLIQLPGLGVTAESLS